MADDRRIVQSFIDGPEFEQLKQCSEFRLGYILALLQINAALVPLVSYIDDTEDDGLKQRMYALIAETQAIRNQIPGVG